MTFPDNRIVADGFTGTWAELGELPLPRAAAVFTPGHLDALRAVWQHATALSKQTGGLTEGAGRETLVASYNRLEPGLTNSLLDAGLAVVSPDGDGGWTTTEPNTDRAAEPGRIWLLTSGSTGRPKMVAHTLDSLTTVKGEQPPRTWLCPYTPGAYAWWQVVTLVLSQPNQKLVCVNPTEAWAEVAAAEGVDAASGTPTFWRQALMSNGDALAAVPLKQITLGGEPVDQAVIDQLKATFPDARVSWIYASSEAGASIAVHDGMAGFPESWLDRDSADRPRLGIDGDELVIASPHRGEGVDDVLRTGDRVERRDGRVYIVGRLASDEINVGGTKVSAAQVRDALLQHPAVAWAAVKGRKAPVVGALVQADVVVSDPAVDEEALARHAASLLPEVAVPRRFRFLDSIPLKESLKSDV